MDLSKLKLELYDLAAIVLPGFFLIGELLALLKGFPQVFLYLHSVSGVELTLLFLCSFAVGNLVQEAGDRLVRQLKGDRFFRQGRDRFWASELKKDVCDRILKLGGPPINSVDVAFDYCLTCLDGAFAKRNVFLAISDLNRSLWVLSLFGVLPLIRSLLDDSGWESRLGIAVEGLVFIALAAWLSWVRMVRFRELSESPVFNSFIAQSSSPGRPRSEASEVAPK
jgi:hypothetical protein